MALNVLPNRHLSKPFCSETFTNSSIFPSEKDVPVSLLRDKVKSTLGEKKMENTSNVQCKYPVEREERNQANLDHLRAGIRSSTSIRVEGVSLKKW